MDAPIQNGTYKSFDENYRPKALTKYKDGLKDGLEIIYSNEGKEIESETEYKDGKKNGKHIVYGYGHRKESETEYKDDVKHGIETIYSYNYGVKSRIGYKNGLKDGWEFIYDSSSRRLISETEYKDGKKNGMEKIYHYNSMKKSITPYKNGLKDGREQTYNDFGTLISEDNYKEGKRHGKSVRYSYDTGHIEASGEYQNDIPVGEIFQYGEFGELRSIIVDVESKSPSHLSLKEYELYMMKKEINTDINELTGVLKNREKNKEIKSDTIISKILKTLTMFSESKLDKLQTYQQKIENLEDKKEIIKIKNKVDNMIQTELNQ